MLPAAIIPNISKPANTFPTKKGVISDALFYVGWLFVRGISPSAWPTRYREHP